MDNEEIREYWERIEKRAKEVEKYPDWKIGGEPIKTEQEPEKELVKSKAANSSGEVH